MQSNQGIFGGHRKFYQGLKEALIRFAKNEWPLLVTKKDGSTLKDHFLSAWKQTGEKPNELVYEPLPQTMVPIWEWFHKLSRRRGHGMSPFPITYFDILAWQVLTGNELDSFDIECIVSLDEVWLSIWG